MFYRMVSGYNRLLDTHPYKTQSITAALLWCTGDLISQAIEHRQGSTSHAASENQPRPHGPPPQPTSPPQASSHTLVPALALGTLCEAAPAIQQPSVAESSHQKPPPWSEFRPDIKRLGIMTGFGLCVAGPLYTFWYSKLDRVVHSYASRNNWASKYSPRSLAVRVTGAKLFADLFVFDPPYLTLFFTSTSLLSGMPFADMLAKYRRDALPTYLVDISVWGPVQTVNFSRVPVAWQPVVVNSGNVFWNAYLSYVGHN
ncbi:hypothetical protein BCR44DRAFT_117133, partial [Catenaria anguillulae PL171]